jgi:hypothetical protein
LARAYIKDKYSIAKGFIMRAKEFTINVPINIKINGDGDPEIDVAGNDSEEPDENPVFVSPLQQELELKKADAGKDSAVIDKLTEPEDVGEEPPDETDDLSRILQLLKR